MSHTFRDIASSPSFSLEDKREDTNSKNSASKNLSISATEFVPSLNVKAKPFEPNLNSLLPQRCSSTDTGLPEQFSSVNAVDDVVKSSGSKAKSSISLPDNMKKKNAGDQKGVEIGLADIDEGNYDEKLEYFQKKATSLNVEQAAQLIYSGGLAQPSLVAEMLIQLEPIPKSAFGQLNFRKALLELLQKNAKNPDEKFGESLNFIAELYIRDEICTNKLLENLIRDFLVAKDLELIRLCGLLEICGKKLDEQMHPMMDKCFQTLEALLSCQDLSINTIDAIENVIAWRNCEWSEEDPNYGYSWDGEEEELGEGNDDINGEEYSLFLQQQYEQLVTGADEIEAQMLLDQDEMEKLDLEEN